jgi:hypothetical protein
LKLFSFESGKKLEKQGFLQGVIWGIDGGNNKNNIHKNIVLTLFQLCT